MEVLDHAPLSERIPAFGEALRLAPEGEREPLALRLFELASAARAPMRDGALGPVELVTRWPSRRRVRWAERAMLELLSGWDRVPDPVRPLASGLARERWLAAARKASESPDPGVRASAARFAEDTADPGLAGVVSGLLSDEHQAVRLHADRAMLRMAMTLLAHLPEGVLGAEFGEIAARPTVRLSADRGVLDLERVELCRHIADASWRFAEHRCRSPLIAALLILDRLPGGTLERSVASRIRRLLKESGHPSHSPLRTVLRRTPSPLLRERALRWIVIDPVRVVCVDRLASAESIEEHEILLSRSYLALRGARGARLRAVRPTGDREHAPVPPARGYQQLSPAARRGMVRFVQLIGLEDEARRVALEPTLADADPLVRLTGSHAAHPADLSDYTFDPVESVALSAATRWSTLGVPAPQAGSGAWSRRTQVATLLRRSPHRSVRALAAAEAERLDPLGATPASRLTARRLLERDPNAFVRLVREGFADPERVLDALMLVRALRMGERFEMDLVELASTAADDRVRATAVAALGTLASEPAGRTVRAALNAPDQRVRSNAVEAVPACDPVLLEFKDDASHRVRASAVRRVLTDHAAADPPAAAARVVAAESLSRMLTDDRAEHRLSGAWAAERVLCPQRRELLGPGWRGLVHRVAEAAEHDADTRVRLRAARCVRRLETLRGAAA
ncbi:MAG: hypothetical protein LAT64_07325 [Phycisphaerales bacterium]|nr:hypothetical protein [Planctomycetota bacterium]MCH8508567.1 hypothetical protein [Phycisphaerales bacterium]